MIQMRHEYLESIDSTNNEIKRRAVAGGDGRACHFCRKADGRQGQERTPVGDTGGHFDRHIAFAATDGSHRPPQQSYSGGCSGGATRN